MITKKSFSIIAFSIDSSRKIEIEFDFREYQYVTAQLSFAEDAFVSKHLKCLNTKTELTIINKAFFLFQFKKFIRTMTIKITIRGIDTNKHRTKKYVISSIYFREKNDQRREMRICIGKKIHLIEDLKTKILIETNVLISKKFVLNFEKSIAVMKNCSVIIFIMTKRHFKLTINHVVNFKNAIIVFSHFQIRAEIHHFDFSNKDSIFESNEINVSRYVHMIYTEISNVLIRNDEEKFIKISRNFCLRRVMKIDFSNVYQMNSEVMNLIMRKSESFYRKAYFRKLLRVCMTAVTTENDFLIKQFISDSVSINFVQIILDIIVSNVQKSFIFQTKKKSSFTITSFISFVN